MGGAIQNLGPYYSSAIKATRVGERLAKTVDLATMVGWVALCHEDASLVEEDIASLQAIEKEITVIADEPEDADSAATSAGCPVQLPAESITLDSCCKHLA